MSGGIDATMAGVMESVQPDVKAYKAAKAMSAALDHTMSHAFRVLERFASPCTGGGNGASS